MDAHTKTHVEATMKTTPTLLQVPQISHNKKVLSGHLWLVENWIILAFSVFS